MDDATLYYRAAFEAAPYGMFVADEGGTLLLVNRSFEKLTGFPAAELIGQRTWLSLHDPAELSRRADAPHLGMYRQRETAHAGEGGSEAGSKARSEGESEAESAASAALPPTHSANWIYIRRNGTPLLVHLALSFTRQPDWLTVSATQPGKYGSRDGPRGISKERSSLFHIGIVTEAHDTESPDDERPRHGAVPRLDPITRLPNQHLLQERIEQSIRRSQRTGQRFSVVVIEHDHLRKLQDSLGPSAIDVTMQVAADRLRSGVTLGDALACVGSTQFFLMQTSVQGEPLAAVETLLERLAKPIGCLGTEVRLTASAGMAIYPEDGSDPTLLMQRAVIALNVARADGGNMVRRFSAEMQSFAARRLQLETALREAIAHKQLSLAFQPQINLKSGKIELMEALLRWTHPTKGVISPAEFIPVAEESGLILPIGEWVMRAACAQASRLIRKFGATPRVAVNVSPMQFQRQDVLKLVRDALQSALLDPHHLEVEITEGVLLADTEQALKTLQALREMGVEIAIDDFGTGYSSLSYLSRFRVDRLKIDRSFVAAMGTDSSSAAIVNTVIAMAHALGIRVTAEGVETREQADRLEQLHCDEVQGYWFSRPLTAALLENLLAPIGGV